MRIVVGIDIDATPARVWEVVEPIEQHVEWMQDALEIRFRTATTRGAGAEFDCLTKVGPVRIVDRFVVTEWEPERVMGISHRGAVTGTGRFTIGPRGATGSRFTWTEDLQFPWWLGGRAGAWCAKPVLQSIWRRNLRNLRQLVEAR